MFGLVRNQSLLGTGTATSAEAIERERKEIEVVKQRVWLEQRGDEEPDLS